MNNRVCVIGGGYWGANHIKTLHELGELGGVVDSDKNLLDQIINTYPYISVYNNLNIALDNNKFIGYIVATPAETHYQIAKEIILKQKHLLVEKPLCLKENEAIELVKLSKKNNVNLMVGHLLLFHPAIKKIKKIIELGDIGNLQYIYSNRLNLGKVRTQENVFWSLAPHDISVFQYINESFPISIKASGATYLQNGIFDSTLTQLKYKEGVEGHIFVSWLHPFKEHRLVAIGSEAMLSFEDTYDYKGLKYYSKKIVMDKGIPENIDGPTEVIDYEEKLPLTEELSYFIDHLDGRKIDIANAVHALEVTKILVEASNKLELQ